jgi:N-acetylglucosamine-6-phosphate deacetylase
VRVFARAKGPGRVLLVTDGTGATGMPDGRYALGAVTITVVGGVARDPDGHLAGSTLTQDQALRNFLRWTGWPLEDVLPGLTVNPARAVGIRAGTIEVGEPADLVLLDPELRVEQTYVGGNRVYQAAHA